MKLINVETRNRLATFVTVVVVLRISKIKKRKTKSNGRESVMLVSLGGIETEVFPKIK